MRKIKQIEQTNCFVFVQNSPNVYKHKTAQSSFTPKMDTSV